MQKQPLHLLIGLMLVTAISLSACSSGSGLSPSSTATGNTSATSLHSMTSGQTTTVSGADGIRLTQLAGPDAVINGAGFTFKILGTATPGTALTNDGRATAAKDGHLIFLNYSLGASTVAGNSSVAASSPSTVLIVNGIRSQAAEGVAVGTSKGLLLSVPNHASTSLELDAAGIDQSISLDTFKRGPEDPALFYRQSTQTQVDPDTGLPQLVDILGSVLTWPFGINCNAYPSCSTPVGSMSFTLQIPNAILRYNLSGSGNGQIGQVPSNPGDAYLIVGVNDQSLHTSNGWNAASPAQVTLTLPGQPPMPPLSPSQASDFGPGTVEWLVPATMTAGTLTFTATNGPTTATGLNSTLVFGTQPPPVSVGFG